MRCTRSGPRSANASRRCRRRRRQAAGATLKQPLVIVTLCALVTGAWAASAGIVGDWAGALEIGAVKLHLVLHVTRGEGGALRAPGRREKARETSAFVGVDSLGFPRGARLEAAMDPEPVFGMRTNEA